MSVVLFTCLLTGLCIYPLISQSNQINQSLIHSLMCLVHRIGRTGRCGKTGVATTFINKSCGAYFSVHSFLSGYFSVALKST